MPPLLGATVFARMTSPGSQAQFSLSSSRSFGFVRSVAKKTVPPSSPVAFELRVTLQWIEPEVWRLVRVPDDIRMDRLHDVLQIAFGWTDSHLHQFHVLDAKGRTSGFVGQPDPDFPGGLQDGRPETQLETKCHLRDFLTGPRDRMIYEYDFGDGWHHEIVVANVTSQTTRLSSAICLDGARACPPEDCGGAPGYNDFVAAVQDPKHPEHDKMLDWVGGSFDPEAFDLTKTNRALLRMKA